ncbi:hypothetical protein B0H11DRAFT_1916849 [Mycena galericulata]|nr:hypothetical protein B0H11DRAFT_1916849 [Mycena galericulata]
MGRSTRTWPRLAHHRDRKQRRSQGVSLEDIAGWRGRTSGCLYKPERWVGSKRTEGERIRESVYNATAYSPRRPPFHLSLAAVTGSYYAGSRAIPASALRFVLYQVLLSAYSPVFPAPLACTCNRATKPGYWKKGRVNANSFLAPHSEPRIRLVIRTRNASSSSSSSSSPPPTRKQRKSYAVSVNHLPV